jgi:solute carrier family 25 carnitine/acylcarnitine transporter 20/29
MDAATDFALRVRGWNDILLAQQSCIRADVHFLAAVWIPTLTITASRTTSFTIYQKAKYSFSAAIGRATGGAEPLVIVNKPGSTPTPATIVCFAAAGCTAGSLTGLFSCMFWYKQSISRSLRLTGPFELMKVLTQNSDRSRTSMDDPTNVRRTYAGKGSLKTAANIVTQRGWLGLYSGFRLQLGSPGLLTLGYVHRQLI